MHAAKTIVDLTVCAGMHRHMRAGAVLSVCPQHVNCKLPVYIRTRSEVWQHGLLHMIRFLCLVKVG